MTLRTGVLSVEEKLLNGRAEQAIRKPGKKERSNNKPKSKDQGKEPEGGFDPTPLPPSDKETFILKFTFHSATRLPYADLDNLSADPYILAQLNTPSLPTRHKQDPSLRFRGRTKRETREPVWEESWIVGGVPQQGGTLRVVVMDEDYVGHDDRLGHFKIKLANIGGPGWKDLDHQVFPLKKRYASTRVNFARLTRLASPRQFIQDKRQDIEDAVVVSVQVIGSLKPGNKLNVGRTFTLGPTRWFQHYSPLLGMIAGTKSSSDDHATQDEEESSGVKEKIKHAAGKDQGKEKNVKKFDFQSNELELRGPLPSELYHRYVDFKWFVSGLFTASGIRGQILNYVLHDQHARIYNYDNKTRSGQFKDDVDYSNLNEENNKPDDAVTRKFLQMAHYGEEGRQFTFVLTLGSVLRFCETGKEFSIDLLSKHMMHADVNVYVAWAGEFLIRPRKGSAQEDRGGHGSRSRRHRDRNQPDQGKHSPAADAPQNKPERSVEKNDNDPTRDPSNYELVIDNDSGTFRPNKDLLPVLHDYLSRNLPGLKITTYDCGDDELAKIKEKNKKLKADRDEQVHYMAHSGSSASSSDVSSLNSRFGGGSGSDHDEAEQPDPYRSKRERGVGLLQNPRKEFEAVTGRKRHG